MAKLNVYEALLFWCRSSMPTMSCGDNSRNIRGLRHPVLVFHLGSLQLFMACQPYGSLPDNSLSAVCNCCDNLVSVES